MFLLQQQPFLQCRAFAGAASPADRGRAAEVVTLLGSVGHVITYFVWKWFPKVNKGSAIPRRVN